MEMRSKRVQRVQTMLAMIGFWIVALIAFELLLRLVFTAWDARKPESASFTYDARAELPAFDDADYDPARMWHEIKSSTSHWLNYEPYTVWSNRPIDGELVKVRDGYRNTLYNSEEPDALRIWMSGGSTTWGMGNPDRETLPSNLARVLNERGIAVNILNLAQTGYGSTQELIAILRELQKREPPDLVVVYDGVNEALGYAERPDMVTPHYLMGRISAIFEQREPNRTSGKVLLGKALETTALARLAKTFRSRLGDGDAATEAPRHKDFHNDADIVDVGTRSAEHLLGNYEFMTALGNEYGFPCFFFFQPQIGVSEKPLHPSEQETLADLLANPEDAWIIRCAREQRRAFRERLAAGATPDHVHDVSGIFADVEMPLLLDWCHVSHNGNRMLADRIGQILLEALCADPALVRDARQAARLGRVCSEGIVGEDRDDS